MAEQICTGLTEAGLGQHPRAQRRDKAAEPQERRGKMLLAQRGAFLADFGFVPFVFERVEFSDQAQRALGGLRPLGDRLEEVPACVGPAAEPLDASMRLHVGRVGVVAVRLKQAAIVVAEQPPGFLVPAG